MQEFQTFYQENLGLIYRYVYSKVGNREEAEDLTSQIFMKAVRGVDTDRGPQSMQKWLFQVARTTIADYWRAHYRVSINSLEELLESGWEGPYDEEPAAVDGKPEDRVQRILQALPEHLSRSPDLSFFAQSLDTRYCYAHEFDGSERQSITVSRTETCR